MPTQQNQGLISGAQTRAGGNQNTVFSSPQSGRAPRSQPKIGQPTTVSDAAVKMPLLQAPGQDLAPTATPDASTAAPGQPQPLQQKPIVSGQQVPEGRGAPSQIKVIPQDVLSGINTILTAKQDTLNKLADTPQVSPGYRPIRG